MSDPEQAPERCSHRTTMECDPASGKRGPLGTPLTRSSGDLRVRCLRCGKATRWYSTVEPERVEAMQQEWADMMAAERTAEMAAWTPEQRLVATIVDEAVRQASSRITRVVADVMTAIAKDKGLL